MPERIYIDPMTRMRYEAMTGRVITAVYASVKEAAVILSIASTGIKYSTDSEGYGDE